MLAELAVGLAGFTGIAAAFGGRDRKYSDPDRVRLLAIFLSAGCVLVGSLCVLTLTSADWSSGQSYRWSGLSAAAVLIPSFYAVIPQSYGFAKDPDATTSFAIVAIAVVANGVSVLLLAGNFIVWREAWPVVGALSMQLVWGLWQAQDSGPALGLGIQPVHQAASFFSCPSRSKNAEGVSPPSDPWGRSSLYS